MKNISKSFSGVRALNDVSISCKKGNVHALVGENGAGKSTLIKILSGAQQPDKGTICF
ncbi:MAG: ATP-binding cassette domain-containing protein, partial [SAR324 cluster bacterium]|nr:ATP-binding cassette domain-containing protein [SAR324 cluster bacterium]